MQAVGQQGGLHALGQVCNRALHHGQCLPVHGAVGHIAFGLGLQLRPVVHAALLRTALAQPVYGQMLGRGKQVGPRGFERGRAAIGQLRRRIGQAQPGFLGQFLRLITAAGLAGQIGHQLLLAGTEKLVPARSGPGSGRGGHGRGEVMNR